MPSTSPDAVSSVVARLRSAGCVFAEEETRLLLSTAQTPADLGVMVERRRAGVPLEHLLGWAEFRGMRVSVAPGVFVPRRRTEFLVHQAATATSPGAVVVDLCCGSGAVGLALAAAVPGIELYASDVDPAAVRCARTNLSGIGQVFEGDLYEPLPEALRGRVGVLVANAPYVPTEAVPLMAPEARLHEPAVALDGGVDGLDVLRRVIGQAPSWLTPGGRLLVETSQPQAARVVQAVTQAGLTPRTARSDDETATVVIGRVGPGPAPTRRRRRTAGGDRDV